VSDPLAIALVAASAAGGLVLVCSALVGRFQRLESRWRAGLSRRWVDHPAEGIRRRQLRHRVSDALDALARGVRTAARVALPRAQLATKATAARTADAISRTSGVTAARTAGALSRTSGAFSRTSDALSARVAVLQDRRRRRQEIAPEPVQPEDPTVERAVPAPPAAENVPAAVPPVAPRRQFGVPPQDTIAILGVVAAILAVVLFSLGSLLPAAMVLIVAVLLLGVYADEVRRRPRSIVARRISAALTWSRAQYSYWSEAAPARAQAWFEQRRLQRRTLSFSRLRDRRLRDLGAAVYEADHDAELTAREALAMLDAAIAANGTEATRIERRAMVRVRRARTRRARTLAT
jgi:hypothetical protein